MNAWTSPRARRITWTILALASVVYAWVTLWHFSANDPWYRNTDMNIHNVADALALNSGMALGIVDQPGTTAKYLLALDFRARNALGSLPVWHVKRFARSAEPLRELATLVHIARVNSRMLVMAIILVAAAFIWQVTRRQDCVCLALMLLSGSSGLLFHGLLMRPELLCVGFGVVLAPYCAWCGFRASRPGARAFWLLAAGVACGLAVLSKIPAICYFAAVVVWGAVDAAGAARGATPRPAWQVPRSSAAAAGLAAGLGLLALLLLVEFPTQWLHPTAVARMRLLAIIAALLPLAGWYAPPSPIARYVSARLLDGALLLAGTIGAVIGWFGLLRLIMPVDQAEVTMAKIMNTVFYPDPLLSLFTQPAEVHRYKEIGRFFMETPMLFACTLVLAIVHTLVRSAAPARRILVLVLLVNALGMVFLMSKRHFTDQYSIFAQVPLLLIWPIALASLHDIWRQRTAPADQTWPEAIVLSGAFLFALAAPVSLHPKYDLYRDDAALPVDALTVTFLYDHDAHPPSYLAAMKRHYPTRNDFVQAVNTYLQDPSNRH